MAENGTPAAVQPGNPAAQPAPAQFTIPTGHRLVPDSDFEKYNRYEQQVRGFEPFRQRLEKAGIKSADDWAKYEPDFQAMQKRGFKPGGFAAAFSPEADQDLNSGGAQPQQIDLAKLREEMKSEASTELHSILYERELQNDPKAVESALTKMLGEGEHDNYTKTLNKHAVNDYLFEIRGVYEKGHPLAGRVKPLTDEMTSKAIEYFSKLKSERAGEDMAEKAKAAAAPKPQGTVGGGGNSGTGKPTTTSKDRFSNRPTDDEIGAEIAKASARRSR